MTKIDTLLDKLCAKPTPVILLQKPHPGDEMIKAAVDSVVTFLKEHGHI